MNTAVSRYMIQVELSWSDSLGWVASAETDYEEDFDQYGCDQIDILLGQLSAGLDDRGVVPFGAML